MARPFLALLFAVVCLIVPLTAVESHHQPLPMPGDSVGAFRVIKVGGAIGDGVQPGSDLCYRCRYGSSPMVMIFARRSGKRLVDLVRRLDTALESNQQHKLRGLLTFVGDDGPTMKDQAAQLVDQCQVERVPITIAVESAGMPSGYPLPTAAEVTVVIARDSQVVASESSSASSIDIESVMNHVQTMLR